MRHNLFELQCRSNQGTHTERPTKQHTGKQYNTAGCTPTNFEQQGTRPAASGLRCSDLSRRGTPRAAHVRRSGGGATGPQAPDRPKYAGTLPSELKERDELHAASVSSFVRSLPTVLPMKLKWKPAQGASTKSHSNFSATPNGENPRPVSAKERTEASRLRHCSQRDKLPNPGIRRNENNR